jgi:predicted alpha-1,6-mannanase (GH76 family)
MKIMLCVVALTAAVLAPTRTDVCNVRCDGSAVPATRGREAVAAELAGRRVSLRFHDVDAMGWAAVDGGPGADVWLDRSFDGGTTWTPRLGLTGDGATTMYNVDDWAGHGVGALRACASIADVVSCTAWARTTWHAGDRRSAAVTGLMQYYRNDTGLFAGTGWWNSANALTAVIDSGMAVYRYAIANTYDRNVTAGLGQFRNEFVDDTGWWALAWVAAYDVTGDRRYLDTATAGAEYMHSFWDDVCGGGVWWRVERTYKNAVTNALYVQLNAALHNRLPADTRYLARARAGWAWYANSGMINLVHLVNDGVDTATCRNNGHETWTYNQGVVLAALVELSRAAADPELLVTARTLAAASTTDAALNPDGVLREPCEPACEQSSESFKGAYVRGLGRLDAVLPDHPYRAYLDRQADAAYRNTRTPLDTYGLRWSGPRTPPTTSTQQSAADLMNAAHP